MFPTIPAILVSVLVPAFYSQVQAQTLPPFTGPATQQFDFEQDRLGRQQTNPLRADDKDAPTVVRAEQTFGRPERDIQFRDNVEIVKGGTTMTSDKASYSFIDDEFAASGQVRMDRYGDCYKGDSLRLQLSTSFGNLINGSYKLLKTNAQGEAERIDFLDDERSIVHNGTYSTCDGPDPDWYLRTNTLDLDSGLDVGVAGRSVLYFMGTPILATPSLSFPLSGARHSGFLPPVVGASSSGGAEFGLPYYFNIAPNRDFTLYPKFIAKRGLQLGAEARYLDPYYRGETTIEGILDDKVTKTNRYAITSVHEQTLMPGLALAWNYNAASDDNYPADFSNSITKTSQRLLLRDLSLTYAPASFWSATFRTTNYQVLQDVTAPIARPYDRLPQLQLHAEQYDVMGFDWSLDTTLTRFWHPDLLRGDRLVVNPKLSLPLVQPGYFVIPQISLHAANYQLANQIAGQPNGMQSVVPTFAIDSGLVFERQSNLFGQPVTQTLEPRLFYVRTPYVDQSALPNFDSGDADFNFSQIFSTNRFTGDDRVGDSNQITAALVSRYLEMDGEELMRLAIGQRFYFNTQRVTLDTTFAPSRSDLLLAATAKVSKSLTADAALQFSQSSNQSVQASYGVRWQPEPKKVLNLAYRFQRDTLEQIDISGQWPVADRWYAVGRSNYSLMDKKIVDGLVGFEYKADCWALRFVLQRFAINSVSNNSGFSIQLELSGLARLGVGNNPIEALKRNISGYQPISER